jgi:membrane-associated phospholipid phosphatase
MTPVPRWLAPAVTVVVLSLSVTGRTAAQVAPTDVLVADAGGAAVGESLPAADGETAPAAPKSAGTTPSKGATQKKPRPAPDDKRRTLRSYGSNLLYDFVGVVTPGNHVPLLVTAALTAPAFAWDDEGIDYFRQHPHKNFGDIGAAMGGGIAISAMTVGIFSAGRVARGDRFRACTYDMSQAVIVNGVYTQVLKLLVHRERPDLSNRQSFPSGHASNAFAAATVVARHYRFLRMPVYGLASFIAISRMASNKHHFSDIVAGAGFGFGVGRSVVRRNGRPPDKPGTIDIKKVYLLPDSGPSGDGRGVAISVAF